jgi:hypothetical protein
MPEQLFEGGIWGDLNKAVRDVKVGGRVETREEIE